jgi:hypothetical protein
MKKKKAQRIEKGPKDDGSRWAVIGEDGRRVYPGDGLRKADAERLAHRLVQDATITCVVESNPS